MDPEARTIREYLKRTRDRLSGSAHLRAQLLALEQRLRLLQEAVGRLEMRQTAALPVEDLEGHEFRVFSQWGEDGIIQHLVRQVPIGRRIFVEFGVENYEEANTRFLLVNDNWSGLVMDASSRHIAHIRNSREYWLYNLKVAEAFITRDNINRLLAENGVAGPIGLLSIDIDGMDYWIWEAIEVVEPAIVVIEYNYRFGPDEAVTVPYDDRFDRWKAHHSILYYGASLRALCLLAERKGYALVGVGSAGLNAFFVRRELRPDSLPEVSPEEAYREGQYCEAHDEQGRRIKVSTEEERRIIAGLPLVRVA
jgi:hypothetical protein